MLELHFTALTCNSNCALLYEKVRVEIEGLTLIKHNRLNSALI